MALKAKDRLRILVVDHNSDMATSLAYLLEIMGHETRVVFDPRHAVTKVDEFRPQVAFVDIGMPGVDGLGVARWLREHYARHELRLVALSAYGDPKTREPAIASSFDAYVVKPVKAKDVETILSVIFPQGAPAR